MPPVDSKSYRCAAYLSPKSRQLATSETLYKVISVLLLIIAVILVVGHDATEGQPLLTGGTQLVAEVSAGFVIRIVASLLGVAGGELLIRTLVLLFGADIKLAGSLSLAVSLPTMLVGFTRYSRDQSFSVLGRNKTFLIIMAAGSIVGTFIGGCLLGIVPNAFLLPALAVILVLSAVKVWRHNWSQIDFRFTRCSSFSASSFRSL